MDQQDPRLAQLAGLLAQQPAPGIGGDIPAPTPTSGDEYRNLLQFMLGMGGGAVGGGGALIAGDIMKGAGRAAMAAPVPPPWGIATKGGGAALTGLGHATQWLGTPAMWGAGAATTVDATREDAGNSMINKWWNEEQQMQARQR